MFNTSASCSILPSVGDFSSRSIVLMYVRLDPTGPWSSHAKEQARKILNAEKLSIVSRGGRLVKAAG